MAGIGCQEADIKLPDGTRVGNGLWGSSVLRSPRRAAGMAPPQLVPTNTTCQIISAADCDEMRPRVQPDTCDTVTTKVNLRCKMLESKPATGRGDMGHADHRMEADCGACPVDP
eukprot:scaffold72340_cov59-Phaeocystis_antarctica.AAC.2